LKRMKEERSRKNKRKKRGNNGAFLGWGAAERNKARKCTSASVTWVNGRKRRRFGKRKTKKKGVYSRVNWSTLRGGGVWEEKTHARSS